MKRFRFRLIAVIAIILAAMIAYSILAPGVSITIRNTGHERMREVMISMTGKTYRMGDLPPGGSKTERVLPEAESQVEVQFKGEAGTLFRLLAGLRLEPASRGEMEIEVKDGKIVGLKNDVRRGAFFR
jgi:hypothetical protein